MALRLRWCVWWRLAGGVGAATAVLHGGVALSMRSPLYACNLSSIHYVDLLLGGPVWSAGGGGRGGAAYRVVRGGDARANAISRLATSSVGAEPAAWPLLWRKRRNHGSWPITAGKGQG